MKNSNLEIVKALIKEMNAQYSEASFTKKFDDSSKLKGGQKNLPDELQAQIVKKEADTKQTYSIDYKIGYGVGARKGYDKGYNDCQSGKKYDQTGISDINENHEGQDHEVSEGLGNDIGDKVYFKPDSNFGKKFPSSEGYYAIIQDVTTASNYNMNALYKVVVHDKDDNKIGTIRADWTNFSNKPINENHEGQDHEVSMANNSLDSIIWAVGELKKHLGDQERDIPAWIQDHITNAENFITQAAKNFHDYGAEEPAEDMSLVAMAPAELNEMIRKRGSKYVVYSKKGKKLGSHPSKKKAQKQMAAIEISKQGK